MEEGRTRKPVHIVMVPLLAPGHMIPMVDLARLLAARGSLVTFVTTPVNLARIRSTADSASSSGLPIRFLDLQFPVTDAGLPNGCESADLVPSFSLMLSFMNALSILRGPLETHLERPDPDGWPRPACLISDNLQHWTSGVARALGIPRLIFHGTSCFFLLCSLLVDRHKAVFGPGLTRPFELPGLLHPVTIERHLLMEIWQADPAWSGYMDQVKAAEDSADGILVNSFDGLESWYLERYHEMTGKPIWPVGPLSLYKEKADAKAARGRVSSIDSRALLRWLDRKEAGSVVWVSFGSTARNTVAQIAELGRGLEASGWTFVWAMKEVGVPGLEEWAAEFGGRVEGRGMVVMGWAPQALALAHAAVGGFVTHCGWNSVLEAVAEAVPMATWPHFWDQFLNEKFVVDVLRIGVVVGPDDRSKLAADNNEDVDVKVGWKEVEKAVHLLMDGGEEGEKRREKARELSKVAKGAMEEGGSSCEALKEVINYVNGVRKTYQMISNINSD